MQSITKELEALGLTQEEAAWAVALAAGGNPDPEWKEWEQYMEEEGWLYDDEDEQRDNFRLWQIGGERG